MWAKPLRISPVPVISPGRSYLVTVSLSASPSGALPRSSSLSAEAVDVVSGELQLPAPSAGGGAEAATPALIMPAEFRGV